MRIAIIGTGISGMAAAHILSRRYEVVAYEAANRLGGHTATFDIEHRSKHYSVDTGFIVFNDWTYPNFKAMLQKLGVIYQPTSMGFSVTCEESGLEYSGGGLDAFFAQRRNLLSLQHWRMIRDIFRFNKEAVVDLNLDDSCSNMTLGEYLHQQGYSQIFVDKYLVPMGSAIWSATSSAIKDFPLKFFVRFFHNHGLLSVTKRPQWHVLKGGSKSYIEPLIAPFKDNILLNTPVDQIHRYDDRVEIKTASGNKEIFDQVIIATHSDQALGLLADASEIEQRVLKAIPYQDNEVVLHTDTSLLPSNRKTWSSWNYRIMQEEHKQTPPVLTYNMNILQSIDAQSTFCVTLNKTEAIDPEKIIGVYHYAHPVFSVDAVAAQEQWETVNGVNRTWFCGAYWGNGFHEDGLNSALRIAEKFGFSSSDNHFSSCR